MANDALYLTEEGETTLFEADSRYVQTEHLPAPPGEPEWVYDAAGLPTINASKKLWTHIDSATIDMRDRAIRRLLTERDQSRELAIELERHVTKGPPALLLRVLDAFKRWGEGERR